MKYYIHIKGKDVFPQKNFSEEEAHLLKNIPHIMDAFLSINFEQQSIIWRDVLSWNNLNQC